MLFNIVSLVSLITLATTVWYALRWLIWEREYKTRFRKRFFISIAILAVGIAGFGILENQKNGDEATRLGFQSTAEYLAAKSENISDPASWAEIVAERARIPALEGAAKGEAEERVAALERQAATERSALEAARNEFFKQPDAEMAFASAAYNALVGVANAENELARGRARQDRKNAMCSAVNGSTVQGWSGTLTQLTTYGDGLGVIEIEISDYVKIATMNNALSDVPYDSLIDPSSRLFAKLSTLQEGQMVVFDARLFRTPNGPDCFIEKSRTFRDSMLAPEFVARFTDIRTFEAE